MMRLLRSEASSGHPDAVAKVLAEAERISIAVAILKNGGARLLVPLLQARLEQGATGDRREWVPVARRPRALGLWLGSFHSIGVSLPA